MSERIFAHRNVGTENSYPTAFAPFFAAANTRRPSPHPKSYTFSPFFIFASSIIFRSVFCDVGTNGAPVYVAYAPGIMIATASASQRILPSLGGKKIMIQRRRIISNMSLSIEWALYNDDCGE